MEVRRVSAEAEEAKANDTGGDTAKSSGTTRGTRASGQGIAECYTLKSRMRENLTSGLMRGLWR